MPTPATLNTTLSRRRFLQVVATGSTVSKSHPPSTTTTPNPLRASSSEPVARKVAKNVGDGQIRQEMGRILTQGEKAHTRRDVLHSLSTMIKGAALSKSEATTQQLQKGVAGVQAAFRWVTNPVGEILQKESKAQTLGKIPKVLWKLGEMSPIKFFKL